MTNEQVPVNLQQLTKSLSLVVNPLALVHLSIKVYQSTPAIGFVILPVPLIHVSLRIHVSSIALLHICAWLEFTKVNASILIEEFLTSLALVIWYCSCHVIS